jgi:hypothetical protein
VQTHLTRRERSHQGRLDVPQHLLRRRDERDGYGETRHNTSRELRRTGEVIVAGIELIAMLSFGDRKRIFIIADHDFAAVVLRARPSGAESGAR